MYAILKLGGHQYRVSAGDRLLIERIPADIGSTVTLEHVLLVGDDGSSAETSAEKLANARVTATVVAHRRGRKLRVFSYKAKKRHRRTLGYRSQLTELQVEDVSVDGAKRDGAKRDGAAAGKARTASTAARAEKREEAPEKAADAPTSKAADATKSARASAAKTAKPAAKDAAPARKTKKSDDGA